MNFGPFQDSSPRLPALAVAALAALYLLAGVTGHDPWKSEDAIHLAIAHGFATQGNWLAPAVAGESWPHTAPLYHWVAALTGRLLDGWLPFHDAARLATSFFGALFLVFLSGAARSFHGDAAGRIAPLLAIGTLGLLVPMHEAQPAIAGLACAALAWWGGGLSLQGRRWGAPLLGFGCGLAFLAHGLVGLIMALAVLPAPILRRDGRGLLLALLAALPLLALWPVLLLQHAPEFWTQWWQNEFAEATRARALPQAKHFEQLAWAAWPLWPLALWSLWLRRRALDGLHLPLLGLVLTLGWFLSGAPRTLAVLSLLLPLILVAAAGADRLRRGAANAFDWFGLMTFSFFAALVWLGASALALEWPPKIARNFDRLAPGFQPDYTAPALALALILTLLWLFSLGLRRAGWRPVFRWAAGVALLWSLTATLWLPWLDHGISYRPVALSLQTAVPRDIDCIERVNLGPAQRAALDYFAGIRTAPAGSAQCGWRLGIAQKQRAAPTGWSEVWRGGRPSDRREIWYLERRLPSP
jgi:4-amino-4-deoxy-L-arabinose transferase-like glycosyltransferase